MVEILGEQHFDVDSGEDPLNPESSINFQNRKKLIRIDVLGIPAKEISSGTGENLDKVLSRINSSIENKKEDKTVIKLVKKLWETSALNASLYESIYDGFLNSSQKEWVVGINKKKSELYGVPMFLKLLSSLSYLWDVEEFAPQKFIITNFDGEVLKAWEKSSKNLFDYEIKKYRLENIFFVNLRGDFYYFRYICPFSWSRGTTCILSRSFLCFCNFVFYRGFDIYIV